MLRANICKRLGAAECDFGKSVAVSREAPRKSSKSEAGGGALLLDNLQSLLMFVIYTARSSRKWLCEIGVCARYSLRGGAAVLNLNQSSRQQLTEHVRCAIGALRIVRKEVSVSADLPC